MRIGIDARLWNQTGIGRYIRNICINLQKIDTKNEYVLFVRNEDRKDIESEIKNKNWKIVATSIKWHSIKEQISFPKTIEKEKLDVVHFPYQLSIPVRYKKPYVITIHDLIRHHFVTGRSSQDAYWLLGFKMLFYKVLINIGAKNAKKIIAVSGTTRDEIFDHLTVNKNNVEVIYEAADDFEVSELQEINIGKYFLYVGNVYQHKNVDKLIDAFKKLIEKKDAKLVFVGKKDYFYEKLIESVSGLTREGKIIFDENATDEKLAGYYKNAVCLVRPSLMEGFSLPPLEAMSVGSLVLASDIPVHKELFGDNIFYFNPTDPVDIEKQMNYVLDLKDKTRSEKIKEGKLLAKKFSWEKAAKETLKVYESSARL